MQRAIQPHPLLAMFDGADANKTTAQRGESTVPLQSLFLINGEFVSKHSSAIARNVLRSSEPFDSRLDELWQRVLGRSPRAEESLAAFQYVQELSEDFAAESVGLSIAEQKAWASVARTLFASNEFIYID